MLLFLELRRPCNSNEDATFAVCAGQRCRQSGKCRPAGAAADAALRLDPTGQLLAVEIQVTLSTLFTDKSPLRCVPALEELTQGHGSTVH